MADEPSSGPSKKSGSEAQTTSEWMKFTGLGVEFIAAIAVCAGIGYGLDRWVGMAPWLLISGVGLGFAVGLMQLIRGARKFFHD